MQCPTCKKKVDASAAGKPGSFFPFCSDRCRLIDLGRWLDGKYQIPVDHHDDEGSDESDIDPLPPRRQPPR